MSIRFITFLNKNLIRCVLHILLYAIITFIGISLFSYSKYDPSFLHYTTTHMHTSNYAGFLGAHCAALLFYTLGISAYFFLISLVVVYYLYVQRTKISVARESVIVCIMMPIILAHYCAAHTHNITVIGCMGAYGYSMLESSLGILCAKIFLYVIFTGSLFILSPLFFIQGARYFINSMHFLYDQMIRHKIMQKIRALIFCIAYTFVIKPCVWLYNFIHSLVSGKAFQESDMIIPNMSDHMEQLRALHYSFKDGEVFDHSIKDVLSTKNEQQKLDNCDTFVQFNSSINDEVESIPLASISVENFNNDNALTSCKQKIYTLPHVDLFIGIPQEKNDNALKQELQERAQLLEKKLERFGVLGAVTAIKRGPVVTLFEYLPHIDTKLSKIIGLEDDLAMALQALSIRIIAPIPGRSVVGFEVANAHRLDVLFSSIIKTDAYADCANALPLVLGQDTIGKEVIVDLARMPHLLIAGSTGSGKSVALNVMLISLLCKLSPVVLKLILIDPKRLEFMSYTDIGHLLFPIVTDPKKVVHILRWVVQEMENRYEKMAALGVRHIFDYNEKMATLKEDIMPFIVIIIDELSDLMLTVGRDIEDLITRITQMARAAGIHMIVATQRPSVDVITGLIKVNFPSRISFRVTSRIDSRTILDCNGADKLLGRGDMLFLDAVNAQLSRVHGAFVSTTEIERVVKHIRAQGMPVYLSVSETYQDDKNNQIEDEIYQEILTFLQHTDDISISLLQRKFRIGYNRSARIIDMLEFQGLIMPLDGGKTRKVIR